ncbi:MAG TPA: glycosyltransferase family 39 protein [Acidobacteriota bacterium]|nr:glycosyltransferase family 39 protein [Acidobacteriota bacterium]
MNTTADFQPRNPEPGTRNPEPHLFSWLSPHKGFCLLLGLALLTRLYYLTGQNFWYDEVYSLNVSNQSWVENIRLAAGDMHPPLFYLVLKVWAAVAGQSVAGLRLLTVGLSLGILTLSYLIARRIATERATLLMTSFLVLSAHQVYFAQEVRMYTLVTVFSLAAALAYRYWFESEQGHLRAILIYILCSVAGMYTHYFGMLIVAAINVHFALAVFQNWQHSRNLALWKPRLMTWVRAQVAIGLLFAPWVPIFLFQAKRGQPWRSPTPPLEAALNVLVFIKEAVIGCASELIDLGQVFIHGVSHFGGYGYVLVYYAAGGTLILIALLIALGLSTQSFVKAEETQYFAAILFLVPLAVAFWVSLRQSIHLSRYLIIITPYLFLLVALALDRLPRRWMVWGAGSIVCLVLMLGLVRYYRMPERDTDLRPVFAAIQARFQPGDKIVIDPDYDDIALMFYAPQYGLQDALIKAEYRPKSQGQILKMREHPEVRQWWVILDYHSQWFTSKEFDTNFSVVSEQSFGGQYPRARLLKVVPVASTATQSQQVLSE